MALFLFTSAVSAFFLDFQIPADLPHHAHVPRCRPAWTRWARCSFRAPSGTPLGWCSPPPWPLTTPRWVRWAQAWQHNWPRTPLRWGRTSRSGRQRSQRPRQRLRWWRCPAATPAAAPARAACLRLWTPSARGTTCSLWCPPPAGTSTPGTTRATCLGACTSGLGAGWGGSSNSTRQRSGCRQGALLLEDAGMQNPVHCRSALPGDGDARRSLSA